MAKPTSTPPSAFVDFNFTNGDLKTLAGALRVIPPEDWPRPDLQALANACGLSTKASANTAWWSVMKKIKSHNSTTGSTLVGTQNTSVPAADARPPAIAAKKRKLKHVPDELKRPVIARADSPASLGGVQPISARSANLSKSQAQPGLRDEINQNPKHAQKADVHIIAGSIMTESVAKKRARNPILYSVLESGTGRITDGTKNPVKRRRRNKTKSDIPAPAQTSHVTSDSLDAHDVMMHIPAPLHSSNGKAPMTAVQQGKGPQGILAASTPKTSVASPSEDARGMQAAKKAYDDLLYEAVAHSDTRDGTTETET